MALFSRTRKNLTVLAERAAVGDLRFSAKTITDGGVASLIEPIPGFVYCNGFAASRITFKRLLDACTFRQSITTNSTINVTVADTTVMFVGMPIEAAGVPAGATVASVVDATHITISAAATASATVTAQFFPYGNGNGSSTFNFPDFCGRFLAGATDGKATGIRINNLLRGGILGSEALALAKANLPTHNHNPGTLAVAAGGGHVHGSSALFPPSVFNAQSNDFAWAQGNGADQAGVSQPKFLDLGTTSSDAHTHAPDGGTKVGDGSADGLASTAHQNVHPHQAIGGVLVAY